MAKKIAVIGAGASGLVAIHCCLDEGILPVCFERTENIGGIWNYTEKVCDNQGSVTNTTVINTSKEMMCFSDFPIPDKFPNFMHNRKVQEYFELYADHFHLRDYIRFSTEILNVRRADDFTLSGNWIVKVKCLKTNQVTEEVYNAVLLCTGHHADKNVPRFKGDDVFTGKIVHTHDYR